MGMISGFIVSAHRIHPDLVTSDSIVIGDYSVHPIDRMVQIDERLYVHVDRWISFRAIDQGVRHDVSVVVLGNEFFFAKDAAIEHVIDLLGLEIASYHNKAKNTAQLIEEWRGKLGEQ